MQLSRRVSRWAMDTALGLNAKEMPRFVFRFLLWLHFDAPNWWLEARRKLAWKLARARVFITPWPVYVAYHGWCCDTGKFSWAHRFRCGYAAWKATTWEELFDLSDGPTGYSFISRREYEAFYEDAWYR